MLGALGSAINHCATLHAIAQSATDFMTALRALHDGTTIALTYAWTNSIEVSFSCTFMPGERRTTASLSACNQAGRLSKMVAEVRLNSKPSWVFRINILDFPPSDRIEAKLVSGISKTILLLKKKV